MYTDHFQLAERPFSSVPSAMCCVLYPSLKSILDRAVEGVDECSGPVMVVGPSGCSKSTLLALLAERFDENFQVVTLNCAAIEERRDLIQCLLYELGLPFQSENVGELRLKLIDFLKSAERCPNGLLLLVDEAHTLSLEVLEELRMITNMVCGDQHQIRLVVAGGRALEEKLGHPKLDSFNQRIAVRCYLNPMTRTETMYYTLAQCQMCGRDGREIFQPSALEKVFALTDGVPRLVTRLCDHALKLAAQNEQTQVTAAGIQSAWLDLQQLPEASTPESVPAGTESGSVIEFGSLDDSPDLEFGTHQETGSSDDAGPLETVPPSDTALDDVAEASSGTEVESASSVDQTLESLMEQLHEIGQVDSAIDDSVESKDESLSDSNVEGTESSQTAQSEMTDAPAQTPKCQSPESLHGTDEGNIGAGEGSSRSEIQALADAIEAARELADRELKDEPEANLEQPGSGTGESHPNAESPLEIGESLSPERQTDSSETYQSSSPLSAQSIFGEGFEEEPVSDIQVALLAEQNRISSDMTTEEVAGLEFESEGEGKSEGQADLSIPQTDAGPSDSERAAQEESDEATLSPTVQDQNSIRPAEIHQDDSDILIIDSADESNAQQVDSEADDTSSSNSPPQGQVVRMNYQDLFQQLRNQNPDARS